MSGNLGFWITPVWFLSVGVTLGAVVLAVLYGFLWLVSRRAAAEVKRTVQEGVLHWISYVVALYVLLCVLTTPMMPWRSVVESLRRIPYVGTQTTTVTIPAHTIDQEVPVGFQSDELRRYEFSSQVDLVVGVEPKKSFSDPLIIVQGNEAYVWTPSSKIERKLTGPITSLYVTNDGDDDAELTIQTTTDVPLVETRQILWTAAAVIAVYLIYLLQTWLMPSLSTIAVATSKEAVAQPIYLISLLCGAFLLLLLVVIPYNTFGEDVKLYKDTGLTAIMTLLAIPVAVWTASVSVADEIEGRTALTLLSKPISRRQFVLGKFVGIVWPIFLLYVVLGAWLLIWVSFKVVYDARESSTDSTWQLCNKEMISVIPGLVLAFLETVVLVAISVAISTKLPMLPNLVICGAIYALGNLGPLIVQSSAGENEFVAFFGKLIPLVLPVLDHFNVQAAAAGGQSVPVSYLLWALLYCVLYSAAMMLLALILFEDRDLA